MDKNQLDLELDPKPAETASKDASGSKFSLKGLIIAAVVVLLLAIFASLGNK